MIEEANETTLTDDEILSNHAYIFDRNTGILYYEQKLQKGVAEATPFCY